MIIHNNSAVVLVNHRAQLVHALGLSETLPDGKHAVDNDGVNALLDLTLNKKRKKATLANPLFRR